MKINRSKTRDSLTLAMAANLKGREGHGGELRQGSMSRSEYSGETRMQEGEGVQAALSLLKIRSHMFKPIKPMPPYTIELILLCLSPFRDSYRTRLEILRSLSAKIVILLTRKER